MANNLKIAVVLSAIDKMSGIINGPVNKSLDKIKELKKASQTKFLEGGAMVATGAGIIASLKPAIDAYEKAEVAATNFKSSLLDNNGQVTKDYTAMVKQATELGNKLPGATPDFLQLYQALHDNGVKTQSILQGTGKAAAYLAVDLKMPMEAAGQYAARMRQSAGVADKDLTKFFDTISQLKTIGVNTDEMMYAFSRSSGTLKQLGLQGLESARNMGVFFAMLNRNGQSGETAATSFNSIIQNILNPKIFAKAAAAASQFNIQFDFFKNGKFLGIEHMIGQFEKLQKLDPTKAAKVINALTGGGQDAQAMSIIIQNGLAGYKAMQDEINSKATLQQKLNEQLGTLTAIKEATAGTIENLMAAFGKGLEPVLKTASNMIGELASKVQLFIEANPQIAKMLSMATLLTGAFLMLGGAIKIIQGIRLAMMALNITMAANPFIAIAMVIIAAASLIYANWEPIKAFFINLWNSVKSYVMPVIDFLKKLFLNFSPIGLIIKHWDKISVFFKSIWEAVKAVIDFGITAIKVVLLNFTPIGLIYKHWDSISAWFENIWNKTKGPFIKIWEWVKEWGKKFYDIGAEFITNLINGIVSKINSFTDTIKGITSKMKQIFLGENTTHTIKTVTDAASKAMPVNKTLSSVRFLPFPQTLPSVSLLPANQKSQMAAMQNIARPNSTISNKTINNRSNPQINFHNQFTINLSGKVTQEDADILMKQVENKFGKMMAKYEQNKKRIGF